MVGSDDIIEAAFIAAFNGELSALCDKALVRKPPEGSPYGTMEIIDVRGMPLGILPTTVEPHELAAFVEILISREQAMDVDRCRA